MKSEYERGIEVGAAIAFGIVGLGNALWSVQHRQRLEALIGPLEEDPTTCQWQEETEEGGLYPQLCSRVVTHISCKPFIKTFTCELHKCRCALPLDRSESLILSGEEVATLF